MCPTPVYYRDIPLLLETLARTCNIWPEIEKELSLGNWTADDWFKAQLLATAVSQRLVQPGTQAAPTQNESPPAQTYLPIQSLFQLLVQLGTQPAQNECQNTAVVQNTVPLQDAPLDLSKNNKSCPAAQMAWQQNAATEFMPLSRTPPLPYEGHYTVQSNVHQQFSAGNTGQQYPSEYPLQPPYQPPYQPLIRPSVTRLRTLPSSIPRSRFRASSESGSASSSARRATRYCQIIPDCQGRDIRKRLGT